MKGLLLKDFYNLSKLQKQYIVIFAVMVIWAYFMKNPAFVGFYAILFSATLVLSSFSFDEYAKFDKYALTMPISREMLVQEKYTLLLLLMGGSMVIGISLAGVLNIMVGGGSFKEIAGTSLIMGCLFVNSYCVVFPKIFQVGVEKTRILLVVVYMAFFAAAYAGMKAAEEINILGKLLDSVGILSCLMVLITAAAVVVSYRSSLKVICRKEW